MIYYLSDINLCPLGTMEKDMIIIVIIYSALAYWAVGETIYKNKIVFHSFGQLFLQKMVLGFTFGVILIPIAVIKYFLSRK